MIYNNNPSSSLLPSLGQEDYEPLPFGYPNYIDSKALARFKREVARATREIHAEVVRLSRHATRSGISTCTKPSKASTAHKATKSRTAVAGTSKARLLVGKQAATAEAVMESIINDTRKMKIGAQSVHSSNGVSPSLSNRKLGISKVNLPPPVKKLERKKSRQSTASSKKSTASKRSRSKAVAAFAIKVKNKMAAHPEQKRTRGTRSKSRVGKHPETSDLQGLSFYKVPDKNEKVARAGETSLHNLILQFQKESRLNSMLHMSQFSNDEASDISQNGGTSSRYRTAPSTPGTQSPASRSRL